MEITVLKTSRKKTLNFYNKYKDIDFEQMNDMIVDLLENIINNINGEMSNSITKDLILMIKDQNHQISSLKTDLDLMKNNIVIKLYDIKKEYIDDIKILINKNDSDNIFKIIDKVEKENNKLIQEIIPKTNTLYYTQYENLMKTFKEELKNSNQNDNFEIKYNNLIKNIESSLINYISKTEDRIQSNITEIKNNDIKNNESQQKINDDLIKYLDKYKNSSLKGEIAENHIENLLNSMYKSAEIKRTTDESKAGDFQMWRESFVPILFEIKNYNVNVPTHEVTKFVRDVNEQNMCGIMISISSGICNKFNYQIDITETNNICLYIHDMNYDADKLKLGVDIIDNLYSKLKLNTINPNEYKISMETLELINNEYQTFIEKRTIAINHIKDSSKKSINLIEELELMNLNKLFSSNSIFTNTSTLKCPYCDFVGTNLKSLAAHQRRCKKNTIKSEISTIIEEDNISKSDTSTIMQDINNTIISDTSTISDDIISGTKVPKKNKKPSK
uniref:Uncharacterized protein n=1 Tax=viral metagenome TaxID=1070528 RepID=A0A6C0EF43_9ZZZZ